MSGICGIVNLDGAPVERTVLEDMTAFMSFRGPDAQDVWIEGSVGFGHTLLRTTFESEHERQPCSLDGKVWITADARIDGRDELRRKIAATGRSLPAPMTAGIPDVELILHAYHAWGADCLDHLIGDFAFAIWDGRSRQLFCARDHFGVKPFFYARIGKGLVFSNTLECVRRHPAVSSVLDDLAIADFLLFETNQDPAGTAFSDIRRLPPAQSLTWSVEDLKLRCYWTLSRKAEIRHRPAGDYVERFRELLDAAVADRLRSSRIGVEMSGGLDSTAVAATASNLLARHAVPFELSASTLVYDRVIPDEERRYAQMTAQMLGMPIHCYAADDYRLFEQYDHQGVPFPEPVHEPDGAAWCESIKTQVARCRVVLTGWDGDALLSESPKPYFRYLLKQCRLLRLLGGMAGFAISERRSLPLRFQSWLAGNKAGGEQQSPFYPAWLNPALEERLELKTRWQQVKTAEPVSHPVRPYAHRSFGYLTQWSNFFDGYDPGVTGLPLEHRHPLLDLRLLDYCLTLPPQPWCVKKRILREAMRRMLPEPVRLRPKTPLGIWPGLHKLGALEASWMDDFIPEPGLDAYVKRARIPGVLGTGDTTNAWENLRPLSLNFWLQKIQSPQRQKKERPMKRNYP